MDIESELVSLKYMIRTIDRIRNMDIKSGLWI